MALRAKRLQSMNTHTEDSEKGQSFNMIIFPNHLWLTNKNGSILYTMNT